jgi:hypothetical protein
MNTIIDLGSELLFDTSSISDPYVRLAMAAVGQNLVKGSPWVAVDKQVAAFWLLSHGGERGRKLFAHNPTARRHA